MYFSIGEAPIQEINDELFDRFQVRLLLKREDKLHPEVSGNKWRKLKYNLMEARKKGHHTLLTFGGAYSNHIFAVAAAGAELGFKTIGVIRGEETSALNYTLSFATEKGMTLHFVSREIFQLRNTYQLHKDLYNKFGDFYCIPEGGANSLGVKGCLEIVEDIDIEFDYLCSSCGTGSTLAGLIVALEGKNKILGFSSLKGAGDGLKKNISEFVKNCSDNEYQNWELIEAYHFGGYAKYTDELISFMNNFKKNTGIPLDPVYTGKMMYGIYDLIKNQYFKKGSVILALHTGGLQGRKGFNERYGELLI